MARRVFTNLQATGLHSLTEERGDRSLDLAFWRETPYHYTLEAVLDLGRGGAGGGGRGGGEGLVGLAVMSSALRAADPGLDSRLRRDFSGLSHISHFKIGRPPPVATLPGVWRYRVSAGTGRPGVSIL